MNEYRKVFKIIEDKEIEIKFSDIKKGMKIKLYEPNNDSVICGCSNIFVAETDAYKNKDGILTFICDEEKNKGEKNEN